MVGYIVVVLLTSFGGRGATWLYDFTFPPEPRRQRTLSMAEAEAKKEVDANSDEVKKYRITDKI